MKFTNQSSISRIVTICFAASVIALATATVADARYEMQAKVRYRTEDGMSDWYNLKVSFLAGRELQQATGEHFRWSSFSNYAAIWFGEGKVAVVEIEEFLFTGGTFTKSSLGFHDEITGKDQSGRYWEICIPKYAFSCS